MIIPTVVLLLVLFYSKKNKSHQMYWIDLYSQAYLSYQFCLDLDKKIDDMFDDPATSYHDWQNMLPVCKYADEWFRITHPNILMFTTREEKVLEIIE